MLTLRYFPSSASIARRYNRRIFIIYIHILTSFYSHLSKKTYLCNVKHIFIINPNAGKNDATIQLEKQLSDFQRTLDYEIYHVEGNAGTMRRYVAQRCQQSPQEQLRFYACGGDGTLKEVMNGMVGQPNAQLACYPCGSGNDYVKYFAPVASFLDLQALVEGTPTPVDITRVEALIDGKMQTHHSINVVNFGLEAQVCRHMEQIRRKPLIGGKNAYTTAIVMAVLHGLRNHCSLKADGEPFHSGAYTLCTVAHGRYVGGQYLCAPRSANNDGLAELCLVKPLSLLRLPFLIGAYAKGIHLDDKRFKKLIRYRRATDIELWGDPMWLCLDGDLIRSSRFHLTVVPQAISFVVPANAKKSVQ